MKVRSIVLISVVLAFLLAACDEETTLTFANQTECGVATIKVTNLESGSLNEYTVDEGKKLVVKIKPSVTYDYEIEYAGRPDSKLTCEPKSGSVMVPERGQDSNFTLIGVTATPSGQ